MATVVALVALRVGLGFHFFYEGVWKIKHSDEFSAEPFLSQAKGPIAPMFYAMLPDINGRTRLDPLAIDPEIKKKTKTEVVHCDWLSDRWESIRKDFLAHYKPRNGDEAAQKSYERLEKQSEKVFGKFKDEVECDYLPSVVADMDAFYKSLDRFEDPENPERAQTAPFQKKRRWEDMMKLRQEAQGWIKELEARESVYKKALYDLLDKDQRELGRPPRTWNIFEWDRGDQINFAVTWGLTAIGFCLIVGLGTRAAALGGACFMFFVVLTQPAWPAIYPHDPPVVGHALLINKDFIEMLTLLLVSTTAVGRWGGLDYFVHYLVVDPFLSRFIRKEQKA